MTTVDRVRTGQDRFRLLRTGLDLSGSEAGQRRVSPVWTGWDWEQWGQVLNCPGDSVVVGTVLGQMSSVPSVSNPACVCVCVWTSPAFPKVSSNPELRPKLTLS